MYNLLDKRKLREIIRLLDPDKFISAVIYSFILSLALCLLAYLYGLSELNLNQLLDSPLSFAVAIFVCGLITNAAYYLYNMTANVIALTFKQKATGALVLLNDSETTLISIIVCVALGFVFWKETRSDPSLFIFHQMLWSLPLGKFVFINTTPKGLLGDIKSIIVNGKGVLFGTMCVIIAFLMSYPKNENAVIIVMVVPIAFIVRKFFLIPLAKRCQ